MADGTAQVNVLHSIPLGKWHCRAKSTIALHNVYTSRHSAASVWHSHGEEKATAQTANTKRSTNRHHLWPNWHSLTHCDFRYIAISQSMQKQTNCLHIICLWGTLPAAHIPASISQNEIPFTTDLISQTSEVFPQHPLHAHTRRPGHPYNPTLYHYFHLLLPPRLIICHLVAWRHQHSHTPTRGGAWN